MANIHFGVNLIPKADNTYTIGNSDYKWQVYVNSINGKSASDALLPTVSSTDNGKILQVSNGAWSIETASGGLPSVSSTDNGKVLGVSSGSWAAVDAPSGLPSVSSTDNGKVLKVASGDWSVEDEQDISGLAPKASPVFTGSISLGRKANTTVGANSFAVGVDVTASGTSSHAEGNTTTASGTYSHAEGQNSIASGMYAHAEGNSATASAGKSHAEGEGTVASGTCSHAEGEFTTASGKYSHAEGNYTTAQRQSQHVSGEYNVLDSSGATTSRGAYAEIIGNGTSTSARSNARTLDWSGNERLMGDIYVGCNADSTGGTKLTAPVAMTGADGTNAGTAGYAPAPAATDNTKYLKGDGTWAVPTNTTYSTFVQSGSSAASGLVPAPSSTAGTTAFLCEDGTWKIPTDTTYSTFVGSGSNAAAGLVPAPGSTAGTSKFLCEDGTWAVPTDTTYSVMTGATSSVAGTSGLVPAPTTGDVDKFLAGDGTYKSGGLPMVILSYGNSTWADFEAAYKNNVIVYCRASSNNNPATGTQGRMAFMAYTNDGTNPTEVEFQYYRSVSTHKSTQMGDEVYVYKLNKTNGWSVTKRLASIQSITGTGITVGYTANTNVITLTNGVTVSDSLTDTSTTAALSAAKGKALQDTIGSATMGTTATTLTGAIAEHEGDITTLNTQITSCIAAEWKNSTSGITIAAGMTADCQITVTKQGYTFIGVIGWIVNTGGSAVCTHVRLYDANTATVRLYNPTSSPITTSTIQVRCLYVKTDSGMLA